MRIVDEIAWDLTLSEMLDMMKTTKCRGLILSCCSRNPHEKVGNEEILEGLSMNL